jgi:hypothetical protein
VALLFMESKTSVLGLPAYKVCIALEDAHQKELASAPKQPLASSYYKVPI